MPELSPDRRDRWYPVLWPGELEPTTAWAEKYFDDRTEAFDYAEQRRAEHPTGRVSGPVPSHEPPAAWVVCVEPV